MQLKVEYFILEYYILLKTLPIICNQNSFYSKYNVLIFKHLGEIYLNIFNAVTLKVPSVRKTIMDKND